MSNSNPNPTNSGGEVSADALAIIAAADARRDKTIETCIWLFIALPAALMLLGIILSMVVAAT